MSEMFALGDPYRRFMGRWSRRLAPLLVEFAGVGQRDRVLDVGTGTGALAAAIAGAAPAAPVVGIDRSAGFVSDAATRRGDRTRFLVGDAQQLPLRNRSFDRTLSMLVMNFIPAPSSALQEMVRVTRPGGIVATAVWDYGEGMAMLRAFWDEVVRLNPAAASIDEREMPLCRRGELGALWSQNGLQQVEEQPITIQQSFESFDDYWAPFLGRIGPAGAYVASLSEAGRLRLESALANRLTGGRRDVPIVLQARAWAVKGRVPVD
jgi:SAM-dependent methyltransferase